MHADMSEEGRDESSPFSPQDSHLMKKVHLHVHLDGAVRPETIFELSQKRGITLPKELDTLSKLKDYFDSISHAQCLTKFLHAFTVIVPPIVGDDDAIYRIAYEFCEDCARQNAYYTEVRYSPYILANCYDNLDHEGEPGHLTPEHVVQVVNRALHDGQRDFGIKVRTILCTMRHRPDWSDTILDLAVKYKDAGVVGIDMAGDENMTETEAVHENHRNMFIKAKELNIHRTVHAGENGTAENVREAVYEFFAERIGHGYHVMDDEQLFTDLKQLNIHFETCPHSSFCTGSVPKDWARHPVKRMADEGANFSINTDDPVLTKSTLDDEFAICRTEIKLTEQQLVEATLNAARSTFLPPGEKEELVKELEEFYASYL